jgi:hypothetical protein
MSAWPSSLPVISTLEGYGIEPVDAIAETEMEAGSPRARRRFTQPLTHYSVAVPMERAQLAIFETFHHYTLKDGAEWFDMPLVNGQGTTICQARISGRPPWRARRVSDTQWEVSFTLLVRNRPIASP